MAIIKESDLIGIGKKFQIDTASGEKMAVVIHDDGRRDMYHFDENDPEEIVSSITLNDAEARQIAAIVGGMSYLPKALEKVEMALDELHIEWVKIQDDCKSIGKTIAELKIREITGATILAFASKHVQKINPGPDDMITAHMTLVVAGERKQVNDLKQLLLCD